MGGSARTWAAVPVILRGSASLPCASLSSSLATSALSVVLPVDAHDEAKTVGRAASYYSHRLQIHVNLTKSYLFLSLTKYVYTNMRIYNTK
jgi:hypothetical protein